MKFIGGELCHTKVSMAPGRMKRFWRSRKEEAKRFLCCYEFCFVFVVRFVCFSACLFVLGFFLFLLFTCFDLFPCIGGPWQGWGEYRGPGGEWNWGDTLKESIKELLRGKKQKNEKRNLETSNFFTERIQPPVALQYISSNINVCLLMFKVYSSEIEKPCTFIAFTL